MVFPPATSFNGDRWLSGGMPASMSYTKCYPSRSVLGAVLVCASTERVTLMHSHALHQLYSRNGILFSGIENRLGMIFESVGTEMLNLVVHPGAHTPGPMGWYSSVQLLQKEAQYILPSTYTAMIPGAGATTHYTSQYRWYMFRPLG